MIIKNLKTSDKNQKITLITLTIFAFICFAISIVSIIGIAQQEVNLSGVEIQSQYNIGQEIQLQNGTLTVDGEEYSVKPTIVYPDGKAYSKDTALLNQTGKYKLVYEANKDGKYYSKTVEFNVYDYLFSNSSNASPFKYITDENYGLSGVRFDLCQGESLLYNKVIDLNKYTKDDTLLKFDATPDESGVRDASAFYIILTDVYNPKSTVTIRIKKAPNDSDQDRSYIVAAHDDNPLTGWGGDEMWQGHANYGHGFDNGLQGANPVKVDQRSTTVHYDIRFDYASKSIYTFNSSRYGLRLVTNLVADFGDNAWQGFTTGEVWMSMYADTYASSNALATFKGMVLEIDGQDLTAGISEDGTVPTYPVTSTNKPIVLMNEYGTTDNAPNAMVGYAYKIFDYEYLSVYENSKVYTNVYYGYRTSSKYELAINNGYFVPDKAGLYTIVYTAVDKFGNVGTTTVDVLAKPKDDLGIYVEVPNYKDYAQGFVGSRFELVDGNDIETNGNYGFVTVNIIAKHLLSGLALDVSDNNFVPYEKGEWEIIYTVTDYAGRVGKFSYTAQVGVSDQVTFNKIKDFPSYLIVGAKNAIPSLTYVDYNAGKQEHPVTEIYAEKNGQKVVDIIDGYFTPTEDGEYNVVYKATSSKNVDGFYKIKVRAIDVDFETGIDVSKYFYSEGIVESFADNNGVNLTLKENAVADFIRPVNATNFDITLNFSKSVQTASSVSVTLTDINNSDERLKFSFRNELGTVVMTLNDAKEYILKNYRFGDVDVAMNVSTGMINIGSNSFKINSYLNGTEYNGFSSLFANLSITAHVDGDTVGNTKVFIKNINRQPLYDMRDDGDVTAPRVVSSGTLPGKLITGEKVTIPYSKIIDVLDPYSYAYLTVKGPDNQPITAVDGTVLSSVDIGKDYEIVLSKSGNYKVLYEYADSFGNGSARPTGNSIQSVSREKPIITIEEEGDKVATVNKEFKIGKATCTGATEDIDLKIFALGPVGNMKLVDMENMTYIPQMAGKYLIRYVAIDGFGNMSTIEYAVTVKSAETQQGE